MTIRTTLIASSLIAASLVSGAAQAALIDRGGGLIYDTDLNVTWLQDANYAQTSGFDADGLMTWSQATAWAANLSYFDSVRNVTYTDWRLPTTLQPDASCGSQGGGNSYGYNCTGSEMGHLFYSELGGPEENSADPDLDKFTNLQAYNHWSATEFAPDTNYAWYFDMESGYQNAEDERIYYYALAVSSGDVAAVPEAETYALMLAGLGLIGWRARRRG